MPYWKRPRARAIWSGKVNNGQLVQLTSLVAMLSRVRWPDALPPEDAARIAHQYVRQCTDYLADRDAQYIRTPHAYVREKIGDCKSTAIFIAALARAAGHDAALKFVKHPGRSHFGHVYALVDGVPVDPLLPFGSEVVSSSHIIVPIT